MLNRKRIFFSLLALIITVLLVVNVEQRIVKYYFGMTTSTVQMEIMNNIEENRMVSTCGEEATKRGPHQRVVSFCLYGGVNFIKRIGQNYFEGIEANAELVKKLYPGWIMRLYHDIPYNRKDDIEILKTFKRRFKNFDLCNCTELPGYGNLAGTQQMLWRFLPMGDPLVDLFVSRDLDSRISAREVEAVQEWLDSGLTFHVMRDNPYHPFPVQGGMWGARPEGARPEGARELLLTLMAQMFVRGRRAEWKGQDQYLLAEVAWPAMRGLTMQHDSYYCQKYRNHGGMRPWSTKRLGPNQTELNYVGAVYAKNAKPEAYICPLECRPAKHKDWTLC